MNLTDPTKEGVKVRIASKSSSISNSRSSPLQKKKIPKRAHDRNPLTMLKREAFAGNECILLHPLTKHLHKIFHYLSSKGNPRQNPPHSKRLYLKKSNLSPKSLRSPATPHLS